jgi:hypothetical protein
MIVPLAGSLAGADAPGGSKLPAVVPCDCSPSSICAHARAHGNAMNGAAVAAAVNGPRCDPLEDP